MVPDSLLQSEADEMLRKAASELRQHLETGHDCRVETILSAFPYLASDPDRAVELIVLEFQLRQQLGHDPRPRDWYERFPQWSEELRIRLEEASAKLDFSKQETAAFTTSPYDDTDRQAFENVHMDIPVLGRHEIVEEIDRGGMGVVYRAYDLVLDRLVALKVIRSGTLASAEEVQRFYREARAAAALRHPNIVPIYGMGLYEKQHCFTMALFPRGSLAQHLADYRQDVRGAVRLLAKVARAVQTAHEQGIIHRDLKPGNILLDEQGEPVVSDFGLAKRMEVSVTLTQPEHAVGTPAYMAPEQTRCEAATTASDIWSLGIILYELLTGRLPFPGKDVDEVKRRVSQDDPISPRRYCPDLPRDLVTIILTCLEKEPARRYKSSDSLAEDLESWLRGEPIHARPPGWLQRRFRALRRHPRITQTVVFAGFAAALLAAPFIFRRPPDPDQPLKEIQHQLKQGKAVTLIGETGPPRWSRWQSPQVSLGPTVAPDQLFTIGAARTLPQNNNQPTWAGVSLLELLPDPVLRSYRFRAEVLHETCYPPFGDVGIYFGHRAYAGAKGTEHCFWQLTFNNIADPPGFVLVPGQPPGHPVGLYCRRYRPAGAFPICDFRINNIPFTYFDVPPNISWRKLAVEVRPEQVQIFWENQAIGELACAEMSKVTGEALRDPLDPINPPADNSPGVGLGLYIRQSSAAFRSVVIEPLEE